MGMGRRSHGVVVGWLKEPLQGSVGVKPSCSEGAIWVARMFHVERQVWVRTHGNTMGWLMGPLQDSVQGEP